MNRESCPLATAPLSAEVSLSLQSFVGRTVDRVCGTQVTPGLFLLPAIQGSLYSGAAGVAFFLHEVARHSNDDKLFEEAVRWSRAAREWARHATRADWGEAQRGFLVGEAGLAYVEALLAARSGDRQGVLAAAEAIQRASDRFDDLRQGIRPTCLHAGVAGVLCAVRDLDARLPVGAEHAAARGVLAEIRERLTASLAASLLAMDEISEHTFLGFALGIAGELWTLAGATLSSDALVEARLAQLAEARQLDEDGFVYWLPSRSRREHAMLASLCHGVTGHALLWGEWARRRPSELASKLAWQATQTCSVLGVQNPTICCGRAGQALVLERYAEISGEAFFSERAHEHLSAAIELVEAEESTWPSLGLWNGALGVALVALSRLTGATAFPCLEPVDRTISR